MKYLILLLSLLPITANAGEIQAKVFTHNFMTDDEIYQRGVSAGIQLSYTPKDSFYIFISQEDIEVRPKVKAFTYTLQGVGIGSKFNVSKNIKVFTQLGYFKVTNDWGDRRREYNEGLYYYLNGRYDSTADGYYQFQEYSVHNDNTFAGEVGAEFTYPLGYGFSVVSSFSYRIMKITEEIHGYYDIWDFDRTGSNWEFQANRNYTSISFALGANYRF